MTTTICGKINKKILRSDGECVPLTQIGDAIVPYTDKHNTQWMLFTRINDMETHFDKEFDQLASEYCIIRDQENNAFIIFLDEEAIEPYL